MVLVLSHKVGSNWPAGDVYEAISRLPWLTAFAAWNSGTTYTRGLHFVDDPTESLAGDPDVGDVRPLLRRYGLRWTLPDQYAFERRRGWVESADSPPRREGDWWDERRRAIMLKTEPGGATALEVEGKYAAFRKGEPRVEPPLYWLDRDGEIELLEGVQWADWAADGRLLIVTSDGRLETWSPAEGSRETIVDLGNLEPDPRPTPSWASKW